MCQDVLLCTYREQGAQFRRGVTMVEIPLELARERYAGHFEVVMRDLRESDDLRVLDFNGERAFHLFHLAELGSPIMHEEGTAEGNT